MKSWRLVRWAGLVTVVGGMFTTFSDLLNLTVYVPGLGEAAHTGYQAVGNGVILVALTLLFVGMVGLFARTPDPRAAKVLEYGDARARYVRVEFSGEEIERPPRAAARERRRERRPVGV